MALTKRSMGMVSATSALRIARSDGRTSPAMPAMTKTCSGRSVPVNAKAISAPANIA
jgi:hypothetical protein